MWGRSTLILGALLVLSAGVAFAGRGKLSRDLDGKQPSDQVNVIVQFKRLPTATNHKAVLHRGGKLRRELKFLRSGAYTLPASALADLEANPDVLYVSTDRPLHSTANAGPVVDYHTETVNASAAWTQGLDGTGIGVAVIDSGIANVNDLNGNTVVYSQDFVGDGAKGDLYGHGTHIAGIIAGNGKGSRGATYSYTFQGIAPNANLISLRALDQNGAGSDSQVIAALDTAIQLKDTYNIRVINLSVGRGVFESYTLDPLCQAVERAWAAGIVVVVSAGNDGRNNSAGTNGYGTITSPGNDPYVITVGAMNTLGTLDRTDDIPGSYSSKGPTLFDQVIKPDLVAPGNMIVSLYSSGETLSQAIPKNVLPHSAYVKNGNRYRSATYFALSGTSMAAPVVSGAAALLLQHNPAMTPDQVKARLMMTAFKNLVPAATATDPTTGQTFKLQADIFTVGSGYLDLQAALADTNLAPSVPGSALSPLTKLDDQGNLLLEPNGSSVIGGQSILWGTSSVFGQSILWGTSVNGESIL
jgi:serine protease AprX